MTSPTQDPDAAMADKHRNACEEVRRRDLSDFLEWLRERYTFGDREGEECFACGAGETSHDSCEKIFAAYFEIDLDAVERYRRRLLEELQAKANPTP